MTINVDIILYVCGAIASISAASAIIYKLFSKAINKSVKEVVDKSIKDNQKEINNQLSKIKDVLEDHINESNESNDLTRDALLSITRDRINRAHTFYMKKTEIGAYTLSTLEDLYKSYTKLGGNSFIHKEMEDLRNLKVINAEEVSIRYANKAKDEEFEDIY